MTWSNYWCLMSLIWYDMFPASDIRNVNSCQYSIYTVFILLYAPIVHIYCKFQLPIWIRLLCSAQMDIIKCESVVWIRLLWLQDKMDSYFCPISLPTLLSWLFVAPSERKILYSKTLGISKNRDKLKSSEYLILKWFKSQTNAQTHRKCRQPDSR